jgi:hypothetical protein
MYFGMVVPLTGVACCCPAGRFLPTGVRVDHPDHHLRRERFLEKIFGEPYSRTSASSWL